MQYIINLTDAEYQKLVKDGVLQVISRRKNGTLQRFKKIMVETVSDSGNTSNLMQQIVKANQSALSAINEIGKNAVQISDTTKNIASNIGLITNSLETIKGLNFVNIALTGVNLCVDVAGFAILSDEIKDVENSIARLSEQVKKLLEHLKQRHWQSTVNALITMSIFLIKKSATLRSTIMSILKIS